MSEGSLVAEQIRHRFLRFKSTTYWGSFIVFIPRVDSQLSLHRVRGEATKQIWMMMVSDKAAKFHDFAARAGVALCTNVGILSLYRHVVYLSRPLYHLA